MRLQVRGEHCFIKPAEQPTETESGLQIVYDRQRSTVRGTVVALGKGPVTAKGVRLPHEVAVGDEVFFSPDAGSELVCEKQTFICLREVDILAVVVQE